MYPVQQQNNQNPGMSYVPPSVGAVGINIYNPTAGGYTPASCPQPYCPQQPMQIPIQQPVQPPAQPVQQQQPAPQPAQPENPGAKKAEIKKEPVVLTDNYLKSLENYLNNPSADLRLMGVKEILNRFKEDKSRANDPALTNLLNKALQDPSQSVRFIALAVVEAGYAEGDDLTVQILKNMQKSDASFNQDAITAANILLKRAGRNLNVQSNVTDTPAQNTQQQAGQQLNVVSK